MQILYTILMPAKNRWKDKDIRILIYNIFQPFSTYYTKIMDDFRAS